MHPSPDYEEQVIGAGPLCPGPSALCAPPTTSQSCPGPEPNPQSLTDFLSQWTTNIQPKFVPLLSSLSRTDAAKSILLCQIYTYLPVLTEGKQKLQSEDICLLGAPVLNEFHQRCYKDGISLDHVGPMGKVWENGDVQVIQYPSNLPRDTYPMDRFPGDAIIHLGEIVFVPVYDAKPNSSTQGIVAVIELMLNRNATDAMIVATIISTLAAIMQDLGLSLSAPSNPATPQVDMAIDRSNSFVSNNAAWSGSGERGMSRTASHRRL